jgi:hypothetical protein
MIGNITAIQSHTTTETAEAVGTEKMIGLSSQLL